MMKFDVILYAVVLFIMYSGILCRPPDLNVKEKPCPNSSIENKYNYTMYAIESGEWYCCYCPPNMVVIEDCAKEDPPSTKCEYSSNLTRPFQHHESQLDPLLIPFIIVSVLLIVFWIMFWFRPQMLLNIKYWIQTKIFRCCSSGRRQVIVDKNEEVLTSKDAKRLDYRLIQTAEEIDRENQLNEQRSHQSTII